MEEPEVTRVRPDTTTHLPCRAGDFLIWTRTDPFRGADRGLDILDLWELRGGEFVTLTNRPDDLPAWFELHPTEVSGAFVLDMMKRLEAGYRPREPIDGQNIWRVRTGDRVAWMGESRPGYPSVSGILALFHLESCALFLGHPADPSQEAWLSFGTLTAGQPSPAVMRRADDAVAAIRRMGSPRSVSIDWSLG